MERKMVISIQYL